MENNIQNQEQPVDNRIGKKEDEIDLVEIVQKLWRNRKFIIKVTAAFAVLGFIVAISTPNVYTASCTLVPQTGQKSTGGSLGGLAAMAGINLGSQSSGEVLSPTVYPKIITNINFQKELIYSKFNFQGFDKPISLLDYYTDKKYQKFNFIGIIKKYTIGLPKLLIRLPNVIIMAFRDQKKVKIKYTSDSISINFFTTAEKQASNIISANLIFNINSKDGSILLTSNMPEPILAAQVVQKEIELLQKYITKFKIEKVTSNLEFVESNYEDARKKFEMKQEELAKFRDSNKSFNSAVAKTQEEKLSSEYNLLLGIYTELAKQKEQAKIAITETTPILTVIEPVVVPTERSKPERLKILLIYSLIGVFIGIGIVIIVSYLENNYIPNIKDYKFLPKIN